MTTQEFSNTFDTLLNSYRDVKAFGQTSSAYSLELDEYEKSILLTQAQDIIVKSYFDRSLNNQGTGFDDNSKRQIDFSELINVGLGVVADTDELPLMKFDERGQLFSVPNNLLFILNEKIAITDINGDHNSNMVIPINYQEYDRLTSKPYGQPLKRQCWRFLHKLASYKKQVEVLTITTASLDPGIYTGSITLNSKVYTYTINASGYPIPTKAQVISQLFFALRLLNIPDWDMTTDYLTTITFTSKYNTRCTGAVYTVTGAVGTVIAGTVETTYGSSSLPQLVVEIIPRNDVTIIDSYKLRYVRRPQPIILSNLTGGEYDTPLDIDGVSVETQCELSPIIHMDILNKAVELALNRVGVNTTGDKDSKSNK